MWSGAANPLALIARPLNLLTGGRIGFPNPRTVHGSSLLYGTRPGG